MQTWRRWGEWRSRVRRLAHAADVLFKRINQLSVFCNASVGPRLVYNTALLYIVCGERHKTIECPSVRPSVCLSVPSTDSDVQPVCRLSAIDRHRPQTGRGQQVSSPDLELGHIVWPSDSVTRESSDPETQLTRWPCSVMNSKCWLICTGWLKIKYPTGEYAISPQSVAWF